MVDYTIYRNQLHTFTTLTTFTSGDNSISINPPSFPVKEIRFDFAYNFKSTSYASILATADIANNELIGCMNNLNYVFNDGKADVYVFNDGLRNSKAISYIAPIPIKVPPGIVFNFKNQISPSVISDCVIVIHLEFLGY